MIKAVEMFIYRHLIKITWRDKINNEEVLGRMFKEQELFNTINEHKSQYHEYIRISKVSFLIFFSVFCELINMKLQEGIIFKFLETL